MPAAILATSDGILLTRESGLFQLFEEAITHATVLIECCAKEPLLRRHAQTIRIMDEHIKNATDNYTAFADAAAMPRGNARRLIYRINKLASLGKKLNAIVETKQTATTKVIKEKSHALDDICGLIRTSITLMTEGHELYD